MDLSRRAFLRGLAAATTLPACALIPGCASTELSNDFEMLEALLPGRVLRPGAPNYARYTQPWNLRWLDRRPVAAAVVRAASAADVATAVRWARDSGIPIVPRSGGHSYAGYSTTDGVIIDVSSMTDVSFDASTGLATVGGGARNRQVYDALEKVNQTLTHGRCYQVGVAGLVLGGGIGFNMRRIGLTCDRLVATEVVLANGETVLASANENADLFWAVRGSGGGQFGIHTRFTFATVVAPELAVFDITFTDSLEKLLPALLAQARTAPRELGLKYTLRATHSATGVTLVLNLLGQWAGPRADLDAWLAPLRAIRAPDPARDAIQLVRYWDGQKLLSDEGAPEYSYERSRYAHRPFDEEALAAVFEKLRTLPAGTASWKGFLTGGAIGDVAADATAFVHRTDWVLTTVDLAWTPDLGQTRVLDALVWLDAFHARMEPFTSTESYQNFIDDSEVDWKTAYHGANFSRLQKVKKQVDPENVFRFAQSIPLA